MSPKRRSLVTGKPQHRASIFAALGDETRLLLVVTLSSGPPCSITELTTGSKLTRQAITKHLRVLEGAGIVHSIRKGRESHFAFNPQPIDGMKTYLDFVSEKWDQALSKLKSFVED